MRLARGDAKARPTAPATPIWCNPPNAAAGTLPTTRTGNRRVDAFLWVERAGYSNGACNGGPARVGAWWEERAIQMVERAKWWRRH